MDNLPEETVKRMLKACKMIKSANKGVIEILKNSTVSSVRMIERNSKSIKDPNPLMSAMNNINLKYPITILKSAIPKRFAFPNGFISNLGDSRRIGRTLCVKDSVQYWVARGPNCSDKEKEFMKKLFEEASKKYRVIDGIKWEEVKFCFGSVNLSRNPIPTNPDRVVIPKELQVGALSIVLGLQNYIEYHEVPSYYLERLNEVIRSSPINLRGISNMIHFLQSYMDPKIRYLPVLPNIDPKFIYASHALFQPQYRATNIEHMINSLQGHNQFLTDLIKNILYHIQKSKSGFYNFKKLLDSCSFYNYPVIKLLEGAEDNKFTRCAKGLIGKPISMCIDKGFIRFYPDPSKTMRVEDRTNTGGHVYTEFHGRETVWFETSDTKGYFTHNAYLIENITLKRTSIRAFKTLLKAVANFCKIGYAKSKGKTDKQIRNEMEKYWEGREHHIINVSQRTFKEILNNLESISKEDYDEGVVVLKEDIEMKPEVHVVPTLINDSLRHPITGQLMSIVPCVPKVSYLDYGFDTTNHQLVYLLHPYIMLKKVSQSNYSTINEIIRKVNMGIFQPSLPEILQIVPEGIRRGVASKARSMVVSLVKVGGNPLSISILYNFTCQSIEAKDNYELEAFTYVSERIHFSFDEGLIIRDLSTGNYKLLGEQMFTIGFTKENNISMRINLVPGFKFRRVVALDKCLKTRTLNWLADNAHLINEKERFNVIFKSCSYLAERDSLIDVETLGTLGRYITVNLSSDVTFNFKETIRKRIRPSSSSSSDKMSSSKRMKLDDPSLFLE